MKWKKLLSILMINIFSHVYAQESLDNIQSILRNDHLEKEAKIKEQQALQEMSEKKIEEDTTGHQFPTQADIWSFLSELWLSKNASKIHWDFQNADFGILKTTIDLFEQLGLIERKIKLLMINSHSYAHGALPMNHGEYLFFISLPFIRSMDLSTLEIALIILEDYFRIELGVFKNYVKDDSWYKKLGTNFHDSKVDVSFIPITLDRYSQMFQSRGYTHSEEKMVTLSMKNILQIDNMKYLIIYQELLKKINGLIQSNKVYEYYPKIYPSPNVKLTQWLNPAYLGD